MNFDVSYGFSKRLQGSTVATAKERITQALMSEGFGVLTEIDVQATLKKKLGVDREPYLILGACNPTLAKQALEREPAIGLLLPCNVVIAQDGADVVVSFASPKAMFRIAEGAENLEAIAVEAETRLQRASAKL